MAARSSPLTHPGAQRPREQRGKSRDQDPRSRHRRLAGYRLRDAMLAEAEAAAARGDLRTLRARGVEAQLLPPVLDQGLDGGGLGIIIARLTIHGYPES